MTEPIKNDYLSIGNVSFSRDEVASHNVIEQNGKKIHCVWLKNGLSLKYPRQKGEGGCVEVHSNSFFGKENTWFRDLHNATIRGSKNLDYFSIYGCKDSKIDVSGDEKLIGGDQVFVSQDLSNKNVVVKRDDGDKIIIPPSGTNYTDTRYEFNIDLYQ